MNKAQLLAKTKTELLEIAQRLGLRGISTLRKGELADRIYTAQIKRSGPRPRQPLGVAAAVKKAAEEVKRRAIRKRKAEAIAKPAAVSKVIVQRTTKPVRAKVATPSAGEVAGLAAHKFDVNPPSQPVAQRLVEENLGELPDSYGTGRLFLTARDPHWLYAYWDLSADQLAKHRAKSVDGRLLLRIFERGVAEPIQDIHLQPDSRNWYLPTPKTATPYKVQLGFWKTRTSFHVISESREVTTPAESVSPAAGGQFVTIPLEIPFRDLFGMIREQVGSQESLGAGLQRLQSAGYKFPFEPGEAGQWSAAQQQALAHLLYDDLLQRLHAGSFEVSEWLRRRLTEELSSGAWSGVFSPAGSSWGSGALGQPQKGFWFAVNAELIIYGATEPTAKVTVDGKPIKLREDGTFSFHYIFPDGNYQLPCVAVSATGDDQRAVQLSFERVTTQQGDVGRVKQPAHLKSPAAA